MSASFHSITPLVPTGGSLAEALRFYVEQLGFALVWQGGGMAGVPVGRCLLLAPRERAVDARSITTSCAA